MRPAPPPQVLHTLRQQVSRERETPNLALADFVAPRSGAGYTGAFVSGRIGEDVIAARFKADKDDYSAIAQARSPTVWPKRCRASASARKEFGLRAGRTYGDELIGKPIAASGQPPAIKSLARSHQEDHAPNLLNQKLRGSRSPRATPCGLDLL
jgi:hypothetical protein